MDFQIAQRRLRFLLVSYAHPADLVTTSASFLLLSHCTALRGRSQSGVLGSRTLDNFDTLTFEPLELCTHSTLGRRTPLRHYFTAYSCMLAFPTIHHTHNQPPGVIMPPIPSPPSVATAQISLRCFVTHILLAAYAPIIRYLGSPYLNANWITFMSWNISHTSGAAVQLLLPVHDSCGTAYAIAASFLVASLNIAIILLGR